jgi:hypothetical protein
LRWLADEQGARWAVLAQLGRVGEPRVFEEAVEWVLAARPYPEEVRARVLLSAGSRTHWPDDGAGSEASCGTAASQTLHRAPRLCRATRQEGRRR